MVDAVSITNDDIKSEWELGDVIQVTMDADGTDGDSDGTDGDRPMAPTANPIATEATPDTRRPCR